MLQCALATTSSRICHQAATQASSASKATKPSSVDTKRGERKACVASSAPRARWLRLQAAMQWHRCWWSSAVSLAETETEAEGAAPSFDVVFIMGELGGASGYMATPMGLARRPGRRRAVGEMAAERDGHESLTSAYGDGSARQALRLCDSARGLGALADRQLVSPDAKLKVDVSQEGPSEKPFARQTRVQVHSQIVEIAYSSDSTYSLNSMISSHSINSFNQLTSVNEFNTQEPALKLFPFIHTGTPSVLSLAVVVLLLSGCASTPPPLQEMAVAEAALQRASSTGTSTAAPGELATAAAKLASARSAMAAGQSERARQLALEATVDAEVAEMRAQSVRSSTAARETEEAARVLREEISRKTPR